MWRQSMKKKFRQKYGLFMKDKWLYKISSFNEKKKDNVRKTFGYLGYPAPIQFSASWTSSYLKSTHYDHVYITFNGLQVI